MRSQFGRRAGVAAGIQLGDQPGFRCAFFEVPQFGSACVGRLEEERRSEDGEVFGVGVRRPDADTRQALRRSLCGCMRVQFSQIAGEHQPAAERYRAPDEIGVRYGSDDTRFEIDDRKRRSGKEVQVGAYTDESVSLTAALPQLVDTVVRRVVRQNATPSGERIVGGGDREPVAGPR